jgi:hypothetical protein
MTSPPWIALGLLATLARADFYVSLNGSDAAAGTLHAPFKSLERAQKAVRGVVNTTYDDVRVYVAPGTYYLDEPLLFTDLDSGNNGHKVVWEAQDMDRGVNVSGGYVILFYVSNERLEIKRSKDSGLTTVATSAPKSPTGLSRTLAKGSILRQRHLGSGPANSSPIRSTLRGPIMLSIGPGSPTTPRATG